MCLEGKLAACEIFSNEWKTGGNGSSSSGFGTWHSKAHTGTALYVVQREVRFKPCLVKAAVAPFEGRVAWRIATPNSSTGNGPIGTAGSAAGLGFRGFDHGTNFKISRRPSTAVAWALPNSSIGNGPLSTEGAEAGFGFGGCDQGTSFRVSRRPSTAVEAGRSKAKKGQSSGSRIERRPPSSRRPKPSKPEENSDGRGGEQQVREADRTPEEELNLTWQDAGLGDRRAGGKFLPDRNAPAKEPQRVGGWGRDKSMQRVVTPEQQQRNGRRGERGRDRRSNRPKSQNNTDAPLVTKKSKWYQGFDDDPSVIHPPEYYINGPFGPHAWKGVAVGKVVKGDFSTNQVVFFSNVKDEAEVLEREKANVAVDYSEMVAKFDGSVGIQFFYVFARRRYGPRPDPWKDWTLVAQIAVESGDKFDVQGELFYEVGSRTQDTVTQCVAWARPDLIYVRKPMFHLRLEPQDDFLNEMFDLLAPTGETDDTDSYYAILCKLVHVNLDASARSVRHGYEGLDEESKLECLKHVFSEHPVKILSSARYERQVKLQQELEGEDGLVYEAAEEETDQESDDPPDEEDESDPTRQILEPSRSFAGSRESRGVEESGGLTDPAGQSLEASRNFAGSMESSGLEKLGEGRRGQFYRPARKFYPHRGGRGPRGATKKVYFKPYFRSAAMPFSYSNLIEEIAHIRIYLCQKQKQSNIRSS